MHAENLTNPLERAWLEETDVLTSDWRVIPPVVWWWATLKSLLRENEGVSGGFIDPIADRLHGKLEVFQDLYSRDYFVFAPVVFESTSVVVLGELISPPEIKAPIPHVPDKETMAGTNVKIRTVGKYPMEDSDKFFGYRKIPTYQARI